MGFLSNDSHMPQGQFEREKEFLHQEVRLWSEPVRMSHLYVSMYQKTKQCALDVKLFLASPKGDFTGKDWMTQ